MMEFWKTLTSCFSCCKKQYKQHKSRSSEFPLSHTYTVRRISSFGRNDSKEDLEKMDQLNEHSSEGLPIPCDRVTLTVQTVNEECEEAKDVKHKKRWKKALSKVHKKQSAVKETKEDNKDSKPPLPSKTPGDDKCDDKGDDCDKTVVDEGDKRLISKDKPKDSRGLNWNKALSAVQKKKACNRSHTMKVPKTETFLTQSDQTINNNIPSLSTTKSSIDLHSMDYLSPTSPRDSSWLKSQSMQDIKSSVSDTNKSSTEDSNEIAKAHGLDLSFYQNSPVSKSAEAVDRARQSLDKPDSYQELPSGTIFFEVDYDAIKKKFMVQVEKVSRLVCRGRKKEAIKFIIKMTVLPGEKDLFSTKKHIVESSIGELFTFHVKDVINKVLRLSLYDSHWKKGKYDAVGHALFYIEDVLQPFSRLHQMKLYKQSMPDVNPGSVQVSMSFLEKADILNLTVIQVDNLNMTVGKCKVFIKVMSFCQGHKIKEKCSAPLYYSKETVFNFTVSLKIDSSGMKHSYLVISVKKVKDVINVKKVKGVIKHDKTVGRLILGPYFYAENGKTYTPWGKVILCNEQITHSFRLYL